MIIQGCQGPGFVIELEYAPGCSNDCPIHCGNDLYCDAPAYDPVCPSKRAPFCHPVSRDNYGRECPTTCPVQPEDPETEFVCHMGFDERVI